MAAPVAFRSSQARDQIQAAAATYTTAVAMPDPFNPLGQIVDWTHASKATWAAAIGFLLNPVHHSGNSYLYSF